MKISKHFITFPLLFLSVIMSPSLYGSEQHVWIETSAKVWQDLTKEKFKIFTPIDIEVTTSEKRLLLKESDVEKLAHYIHHKYKRCGGFIIVENSAPRIREKNLIASSIPEIEFGEFWPNELDKFIFLDYSISRQEMVKDWIRSISEIHMNEVITHLTSFHTRYYKSQEGINALKWIGSAWESLTKIRNDVTIEYFKHKDFEQPSIILTIKGSDSILNKEIIIIGGHGDSINSDDQHADLSAPGADDNAAGIALMSDMIKILVEKNYRPKRTIQFIAYAAEEVGLRGSSELAKKYLAEKKRVVGVMQFDGVNYKGKTFEMSIIADGVNPEQSKFVARLVDEYVKASWAWEKCGFACSDHYSWHIEGYRASFPAETIASEQNPYFHTSQDTFDKSNYSSAHAATFEKLGIAYLLEMDK